MTRALMVARASCRILVSTIRIALPTLCHAKASKLAPWWSSRIASRRDHVVAVDSLIVRDMRAWLHRDGTPLPLLRLRDRAVERRPLRGALQESQSGLRHRQALCLRGHDRTESRCAL